VRAFLIIVTLLILQLTSYSQCLDTTLTKKDIANIKYLEGLPINSYTGMEIRDFLNKEKIKDYCNIILIQKIIGVYTGLHVFYKGNIKLDLIVSYKQCKCEPYPDKKLVVQQMMVCKIVKIEVIN
jgi:hypothetical protein